jgi:small subunit ribosomal protein S16
VAVRIRLKRTGRRNLPSFRICVFDGRTRRDGPPIEVVGWFNPLMREAGRGFKVEADRVEHWIGRGAKMTLAVAQLLGKQGVKLTLPVKAAPKAPVKKEGKAKKVPLPDKDTTARRKRKLAKRESRRAHLVKKAAAARAAADKKAGAAAGKE